MSEKLKKIVNEIGSDGEAYELKRWQLKVHTFLQHTYDVEVASTFSSMANTNNLWDDVAKQKGYLEAFLDNISDAQREKENSKIIPADVESLIKILVHKASKSIQPLKKRRKGCQAIDFDNEYDYQDYLHSMLIPWVKDIRPEEYVPSYAGTSKRVDFLLKDHQTFIEIKYARDKNHAKKIGEEITIDIHHYQSHPKCRYLVAVIFDPNQHIVNPDGFMSDLSKKYINGEKELDVKIYIPN